MNIQDNIPQEMRSPFEEIKVTDGEGREWWNSRQLANYRENSIIEAKKALGGLPASLWETYSAFANTDGGTILLGVEEQEDHSLRVIGLKDAIKMEKDFWNRVNSRQTISVNLLTNKRVHIETVDGKDILVIEVPRAERTMKPVYTGQEPKNGTYRRNGEGDYLCTIEEVSAMYRDAALSSMDTKVLKEMDNSVFCKESIKSYRQVFNGYHPSHVWRDLEDEVFLRRVGAIGVADDGTLHPTAAGLLMFGYEYEIVREFPQYFLDYQENRQMGATRWTDRIVSSSGEWSGNVFDFIYKVTPRLCADLKVPFVLKGMNRVDDTPLHKLMREAVTNSCAHADFYGRRGLVIQKGEGTFTFSNPGCLRVSKKEAIEGGISDPRNDTMLKMLSMINYGERAGSGMNGIFIVWEKVYHCLPSFEEQIGIDRMKLTLDTEGREPDMDALLALYGETSDNEPKTSVKTENQEGINVKTSATATKQALKASDKIALLKGVSTKTRDNLQRILKYMDTHPTVNSSEIAGLLSLSRDRSRLLLTKLVDEDILSSSGENKERTYSLKSMYKSMI